MATAPDDRGNCAPNSPDEDQRIYTRAHSNEIMARTLGREMRVQKVTTEQLEKLSGLKAKRIDKLRSFSEELPIELADILSIAEVLGPRFVSGLLAPANMYSTEYNGTSPEKIADQIIELADQLKGGGK